HRGGKGGAGIGRDGSALPEWGRQGRAPHWALTSFLLSSLSPSSSSCHPPPVSPRPAEVCCFWNLGEGQNAVKEKIPYGGGRRPRNPTSWGPGVARSALLLSVRRLPVPLALHEFLIERDALLAERTALGRIRRKIPADQAEHLLATDPRLLRAPP